MPTPVSTADSVPRRRSRRAALARLRDLALVAAAFGMVIGTTVLAHAATMPPNVGSDPTREFYEEVTRVFAAEWTAKTGEVPSIEASHGGSGEQARSVVDGSTPTS